MVAGAVTEGSGAGDLAGLQTGRADPHPAGGAATGRRAHQLNVGEPAPLGPPVRVGHIVAEARSLTANVAHAGHGMLLQDRRSWLRSEVPAGTGNPYRLPHRLIGAPTGCHRAAGLVVADASGPPGSPV